MTTPPYTPIIEVYVGDTWVDVSQRARREPVVIERGRSDEASATQPSKTTIVLDNTDGAFTPGNAMSPYYPDAKRGMPVRVRMPGGTSHLAQAGGANNYSSTPDHASLDITGPLFVAAEATVPSLHSFGGPVVAYDLVYKWGAAGVRSYYLFAGGGRIWLYWSNDGTAENLVSTAYVPITADGRMAYGAELVTNDGAGGHYVQFYVAEQLGDPWTAIGDRESAFVGTTSVHAGTAALLVGRHAGKTFRAEVRSGTRFGTVVANPDFTTRPVGTASFADSTGKTWSFVGTARIEDYSTRFYGAADAVELTWPKPVQRGSTIPQVAHATVPSSVAIRRLLQGNKALDSTIRRLVTAPERTANIQAYWPMEDGREATQAASPIPGVQPMIVGGGLQFGSDSSLVSSGPLPSVPAGESYGWNGKVPPPPAGTTQQRYDMFFYIQTPDVDPSARTMLFHVGCTGTVRAVRCWINDTNVEMTFRDSEGSVIGSAVTFSSDPRFFNTWCLMTLNLSQNGANIDWALNLVPIPLGIAFGTSGTLNSRTFERMNAVAILEEAAPPDGISVGHFVVSTGLGLGWLAGGDTAWIGETAAHRFHRLCKEEEVPYAVIGDPTVLDYFRGDPSMSKLMGPQRQLTLLELLQECVDVDGGRFLERKDAPGLVMRLARTMHNQDPKVTFNVGLGQMAPSFRATQDDQFYRNDITATRPEGSSAHATTDPPPDPTETYDDNVEVNVAADPQLLDQASWRVHLFSRDDLRHPDWSSNLGKAGTGITRQWTEVIEGDRLEATGLMDQHPETVAVLVEGWHELLDGFTWTVGVNGSPADRWDVGVREDLVLGRRDTAASELASPGITATAVSLGVTVTQGPGWTEESTDFPFDLDVGGEQITATGWVDFGGLYVFTGLVRSVNGVVKAHPTGTPVRLWKPAVRAL